MTTQHLSICPIADEKHLYPYQCCCNVIALTQDKLVKYMLDLCKHSVTRPCWKCRELAEKLTKYKFKENSDTI